MSSRCRALGCEALAIGGVADHVHVLAMLAPDVSVAALVSGIKAPTSTFVKRALHLSDFAWQAGYGGFTVNANDLELVRGYVVEQARHHALETVRSAWEATPGEPGP